MSTKIALLDALGVVQRKRIGFLEIDCVMFEGIRMNNTVTASPIETGESISDHMFNEPIEISMDCIVSDDDPTRFIQNIIGGVQGLISGEGIQEQVSARVNAYETLKDLWQNKGVIDVVTGFETFSNMAITSIDIPRANEDGRSIKFNVTMVQITILPSAYTSKTGGFSNTGRQSGTIANNSVEAIGSRLLSKLPKRGVA